MLLQPENHIHLPPPQDTETPGEQLSLPPPENGGPGKHRRIDPFVLLVLHTPVYQDWSHYILSSELPGHPLTPDVRRLYRSIGAAFLGFLLRPHKAALLPESAPKASPSLVNEVLGAALKECTSEQVQEFCGGQEKKGKGAAKEAASVIRNHFCRWALAGGRSSREAFPHLLDERYESVLKESALLRAFDAHLQTLSETEEAPLAAESRANVRRVVCRFLRTVTRDRYPEIGAMEKEPEYASFASLLDTLVTQQLKQCLEGYCRLKCDGGNFESKHGVHSARSILYKYFAKLVPGGDALTRPGSDKEAPRASAKRNDRGGSAKEELSDAHLPAPPEKERLVPDPSPEEMRARYQERLEEALSLLSKALRVSRQDLSALGLSDVRDINFKLRVFTSRIPSLSGRGNYVDLDDHHAYQAVARYLEACRKRPSRQKFFFETFEGASVAPPSVKKRR